MLSLYFIAFDPESLHSSPPWPMLEERSCLGGASLLIHTISAVGSHWLEPNAISFLRTRISEAETLVQTIEDRMNEPSAKIFELTRQKDAKLVEIASLRNFLAPVRRAPLEILMEIFTLFLEDPDVCVAWRKAAHATPRLWSTLCISLEDVVLGPELIWVKDWITRCRTVPLNLYLDFHVEEYDPGSRDVFTARGKQFLEYILPQFSHKVRLLDVIGHPSLFLPILHLSPSSSLLSLPVEEISLTIFEDEDDTIKNMVDLFPRKVEVFLGAPKLRQVELNDAFLLELLALPAEQLMLLNVDMGDRFDVMFVDILPRCKQLVKLEIDLPLPFSTRPSVLLPTLRSLEVTCCYDTADNVLRCITTPVLEQLSLDYLSFNLGSLFTDVTAFQQRSSTALSSLNLHILCSHEVEIITEKLIGILYLFPTIRLLKIHPNGFNLHLLIQAMICDCSKDQHVLPNLKNLLLSGYGGTKDYLSASGFRSMVLSQW
ncbi:hypothetical protein BT96DRAFT_987889 [Gymnopus androsaceus JB14]|uniref:F-box domain-containing protein n=1 Tax=Gymnopus androsaceus JB14 TaxID=1447944 RepID=A0A6A4I9B7_9AGAR|nr:hypothetical protein BT96DRAFT_987889 [Gymnopus androsaceus JB14]